MTIQDLLKFMVARQASDLHLKAMRPPLLRLNKKLVPGGETVLEPDQINSMLNSILTERQKARLEENLWLDLGYSLPGVSRFRVSITHQRGTLSAVFRRIPFEFPSLEEWSLPEVLTEFTAMTDGLVLVTGPTGSGKSSTLAALLRAIADTRPQHVVTIEDPIEFLITDGVAAVTQREVGTDTHTFNDALRNVLRQDPDVIVVGEMRDLETMSTALTAAETGHVVFSTLHTNSAAQTINRIIDAFPPKQHNQVRSQLAQVLQGIISLRLIPRRDRKSLVAAVEILRQTPRIAKLISEGNTAEIESEMEKSVSFFKMQTMNQSLMALLMNDEVDMDSARAASNKPEDFEREVRRMSMDHSLGMEGAEMGESKADFSRIVELQEVKRLYDESQERHQMELSEKQQIIDQLSAELSDRDRKLSDSSQNLDQGTAAVEKIRKQAMFMKQELEAKITKLQTRVKELSGTGGDPGSTASRKGFFSR